jgi:hypothetical protein
MSEQFEKDAAFYWSVCVLRRLREMGLLTADEYEKIRDISAKYYGTRLLCV